MCETKNDPRPANSGSKPHAVHVSDPSCLLSASLTSQDKDFSKGMLAKYSGQQVKDDNGLELLKGYQVILATSSAPSELVKVVDMFGFAVEEPLAQEVVEFLTANEDLWELDYALLDLELHRELRSLRKQDYDTLRTRSNDLLL